MKMKQGRALAKLGVILAGAMLTASVFAGEVTWDRLVNSEKEPQNWLNHHGNLEAHRFSGLDQINVKNVKKLKVAYTWAMGGTQGGGKDIIKWPFAGLEGTPVAEDGFLYITTGWGVVTKLDTRGGAPRMVWQYNPAPDPDYATTVACCGINNRGAVLAGNMVISPVIDGRILALNKTDGSKIWEAQVADPGKSEVITGAPLIVKDMVVTGMAGAEYGVRGWLEALDIKTGKRRWRTYTIPAPGEPGSETWKDKHGAWKTGGGTTWVTGSYDPELNVIIWGTANPGPDWDNAYRPGDNLWTDSTIAVDADSGKIKWGFQHTPNDPYDYDSINENTFVDTQINGKFVRATLHANRNGYAYALDRKTGEPVHAVRVGSELVRRPRRQMQAEILRSEKGRPDLHAGYRRGPRNGDQGSGHRGRRVASGAYGWQELAAHDLQPADQPLLHPDDRRLQQGVRGSRHTGRIQASPAVPGRRTVLDL